MARIARGNLAFAVGALLAVAVLAGAADHAEGSLSPISLPTQMLTVAAQTALWLLLAADVLLLVGMVYAAITDGPRVAGSPRKFSPLSYLVALLPALLAVVFLYLHPQASRIPLFALPSLGFGGRPLLPSNAAAGSAGTGDLTWLSVLLAALLTTAFLIWLFWPAGRRRSPIRVARPAPVSEESVVEAIDDSIDALSAIADPRRAIIAAYSAMEASLGRAGVPRRRAETPIEFLTRALRSVFEISGDARRLTHLFEVAKFSRHEIDESMRSDALQALREIRARLSAAPAT